MAYEVTYAGVNLNDYCKVLNIKKSVLPPRENFSKAIPTMMGSYFTGFKYGEREITIEVGIVAISREDLAQKIRALANVLDVKNPSKLEISDEPNLYYYAVLDGDTNFEKKFNTTQFELKFKCHNPIAYSKTWKTFQPNGNIFTIENDGTTDTSCIVDVDFEKEACFFQCTNPIGATVLIGQPKDATKPVKPVTDVLVNDDCTDSTSYIDLPESLLDMKRKTGGAFGVGYNGTGLVCNNYGSDVENNWVGTAFKKSIGQNVEEFEVEIDVAFSSQGKNYYIPPAPTKPPVPPSGNHGGADYKNYGTYKVVNCGGLWINREQNTKHPLHAMEPGALVYPYEFSKNKKWAKHKHKTRWGTYDGWSYMRYLKKISNKGRTGAYAVVTPKTFGANSFGEEFAEYQVGLMEIYGFDANGAKLFKIQISDTNEFYEYVEPQVFIGNKLVLDDGKNCPSPRKVDVKDDNGKVTGKREVESGVYGDWNDLIGKVTVRREKNSKGQYFWSASVSKYKDGKLIRTMSTSNSLSNSSYPNGALNYLGFYIGKYDKKNPVDLVAIDNIKVRQLNMKMDSKLETNPSLFKEGDHLQIDFDKGLVLLNEREFLTSLDIGSEFFTIPTGTSQMAFKSDDDEAKVLCGIQEKFL